MQTQFRILPYGTSKLLTLEACLMKHPVTSIRSMILLKSSRLKTGMAIMLVLLNFVNLPESTSDIVKASQTKTEFFGWSSHAKLSCPSIKSKSFFFFFSHSVVILGNLISLTKNKKSGTLIYDVIAFHNTEYKSLGQDKKNNNLLTSPPPPSLLANKYITRKEAWLPQSHKIGIKIYLLALPGERCAMPFTRAIHRWELKLYHKTAVLSIVWTWQLMVVLFYRWNEQHLTTHLI